MPSLGLPEFLLFVAIIGGLATLAVRASRSASASSTGASAEPPAVSSGFIAAVLVGLALLALFVSGVPLAEFSGLAVIWLFMAAIGAAIGTLRARVGAGFLLGLLLGPIGWLLVLVGPDYRPKCPLCLGVVIAGAVRCKNCGGDLSTAFGNHAPVPKE